MPEVFPKTRNTWFERIGIYLLGVAIGCVLVGIFMLGRARALRTEQPPQPAGQHSAPAPGQPAQAPAGR